MLLSSTYLEDRANTAFHVSPSRVCSVHLYLTAACVLGRSEFLMTVLFDFLSETEIPSTVML